MTTFLYLQYLLRMQWLDLPAGALPLCYDHPPALTIYDPLNEN